MTKKRHCIDGEWYEGPYRTDGRDGEILATDLWHYDRLPPKRRVHDRLMTELTIASFQKMALLNACKPRSKKK